MLKSIAAVVAVLLVLFPPEQAAAAPKRIVSLSACADQFVLGLVPRERIAAVSVYADDARLSLFRDRAEGVRKIRGALEEVIALQPDLVVANRWGHTKTLGALERLGVAVLRLDLVPTVEEAFAETERAAAVMGVGEAGIAAVAEARHALAPPDAPIDPPPDAAPAPVAVYVMPGGTTAGGKSYVHSVFEAAHIRNAAAEAGKVGWTALPIEELIMADPQMLVFSFFRSDAASLKQRYRRHAALRHLTDRAVVIDVPGKYWICGAWFLHLAVDEIRKGKP